MCFKTTTTTVPDDLSALRALFFQVLAKRPFRPHPLIPLGDLQTLAASQIRRDFHWGWRQCQKGRVDLPDGTRVHTQLALQEKPAPALVAMHGMGGSIDSVYMQALSHKAHREGWNAVLLNLYDMNPNHGKPTIFHSGSSSPVREILRALIRRHGFDDLFVIGVSMSGNILLKLLGESPATVPKPVKAAAVISPLVDMTISWQILEAPRNALYRVHFVKGLKQLTRRRAQFLAPYVDIEALLQIRTIREFDELFTAPMAGFKNALDYYEKGSSAPVLKKIRVPTLVIHSKDDPLLPWEPLTRKGAAANPSLHICLTERGGHVGFVERKRVDIDRCWAENRVIDFFRLARGV